MSTNDISTSTPGSATISIWHSMMPPFLLLTVVITCIAIFSFISVKNMVTREVAADLEAIAKLKTSQVEHWLSDHRDNAALLATSQLSTDLQQWLDGGRTDNRLKNRLLAQLDFPGVSHYRDISLLSAVDGSQLLRTGGHADLPTIRMQALESVRQETARFEDSHETSKINAAENKIGLFKPVRAAGGHVLAVIHVTLDPGETLFPLLQKWPGASMSAETMLLRREGDEVLYLNTARHIGDSALRLRRPLATKNFVAARLIREGQGFFEANDYRSVPALAYGMPVAGTSWFLVAKMDRAEAYAQLYTVARITAALLASLLLICAWWMVVRKRAELALKNSLREIEDIYQNAPCGYHSIDEHGTFIRINDTELKLLGYSRDEVVGKMRFPDLITPASKTKFEVNYPRFMASGLVKDMECEFVRKDGTIVPVLINATAIKDGTGRYVMSRTTVHDLTERKLVEKVQHRLSRALRLLSTCNMTLVRADDEQVLLDSICRLIVETGGYLMAWVGVAEYDAEKTVRVVSRYGDETEYLDTIRVSWGDSDLGRGPTGTALRTGITQVNQNCLGNPAMTPWREAALKCGYQSSAALPLVDDGGVFGVLTLYAAEPNVFGSDEMTLLEELAGDLAFGITSLRSRRARLQAEHELRQAQERLQGLFGSIQDAVFVHELRADGVPGCFVEVNDVACERLGYSRAELLALSPMDIDAPECQADLASAVEQLEARKTAVFARIHLTRDGRRIPVELSASIFMLHGQRMVVTLARDITERKQAEEMLRHERDFAEGLINTAQTIILVLDTQGCIIRINPYLEAISGYALAEVQGKDWFSTFLPKPTQERVKGTFLKAINDIRTHGNVDAIVTRDGQEHLIEWYDKTLKDSTGKTIGLLAIGQDVTERKWVEAALRESEQEFRSLAENLPDIVIRYDRDCRHTYANPAYKQKAGITARAVLNVVPDASWSSKPRMPIEKFEILLHRVIKTGEPEELVESWCRMPDSVIVHYALRIVAERDDAGDIKGALVIGRDITDLMGAKRRLEESRTQLRALAIRRESAREEERRHIARELHDELGQQLTALRFGVSLLEVQFGKDLPRLHEKTANLLSMVDKTIQIMRDVSTSLRPMALDMGIVPALEWLSAEFSQHSGIPCDLMMPQANVTMHEEQAVALFRIAQESLTNAARHSKTERLQITFRCEAKNYVLEIKDYGIGFDALDQGKQKSFGIMGIRERTLAVGGEVDISSKPGQGTVVRVTFPMTKTGAVNDA